MKSRRMKKALIITGCVIAALGILFVTAFQVFFRLPHPSYSGTLTLDGLKEPVEVRTDDHGIPHLLARNMEDLFFAQGFITARERMFQMDLTRLAGRGELSTLFGESQLKTDKYFKTLGFYRASEAEYGNLSPRAKSIVDAYTRGVNAYINTARFPSFEYVLLRGKPQPWKPADSLVGALLMSYRLNAPRSIKPILNDISKHAGPKMLEQLLPYIPQDAPTVSSAREDKGQGLSSMTAELTRSEPLVDTFREPDFPLLMRIRASNWMVFSGSKTTTGKPIFSGSPDLEPAIPSLFYLIHLKGGGYDVIGGSIPGLPGVHALGFNGHIAWSITVGNGDNTDFFVEKLNPNNPDQYLTEEGYKNFEIVNETLKIKGKGGIREENLRVKISRHGPIISDIMTGMPQNCTMMWPGLLGHDGTLEGLLGLNRARNFDEFRKALSVVRGGSVHMGYADMDGNIGYQYLSTLPIRKSGENPVPRPGENGEYDWTGYLPFEDHPYAFNPEKGYLASFNQMPERGIDYGTAYFLFERPYRFEEIVKSKDKFSAEDVRKMQTDVGSNPAKRWKPLILRVCGGIEGVSTYAASLRDWDCAITLDSSQATLFNAFFTHLMTNTLENKLGKKVMEELYADLHVSIPAQWLIRSMDDNNHWIWDDQSTPNIKETRDDMILKSLRDAVSELSGRFGKDESKWAWGKVHTMTITHPMGGMLPFLNLSPVPYPGDDFTINAGWWDREKPFDMTSGAAIRIVVDMSNLDTMTLMIPPGQSGHYLSPYYSDLADLWAKGDQIPAHYTDAQSLKQLLVLQPARGT
jgi:penicillin amidase